MYEKEREQTFTNNADNCCVGYDVYTPSGERVPVGHTACYAGVRTNGQKDCIIINKLQERYQGTSKISKVNKKLYLQWLFNDSPFADTFITKDAEEALTSKLVVSTCNLSGQLVVGGMIAMRGMWETGMTNKSVLHFDKLLEAGCTGDFAFVLGHLMTGSSNPAIGFGGYGGHCALDPTRFTTGYLTNFLKHTPKENKPFYVTNNYSGVYDLWYSVKDSREHFSEWVKRNYGGYVESTETINPFGASKTYHTGANISDTGDVLIEKLGKLCGKFYEEFVNEK